MGQLGRTKVGYYPDLGLNEAVELARKISEVGGKISQTGLAKMVGIDPRGAGLHSRISDMMAYGLLAEEQDGDLKLTDLGEGVASEHNSAYAWGAFLGIPLYQEMHQRLKGKDPDKSVLNHILYEITKAEPEAISRRVARLKNNYMEGVQYSPSGAGLLEQAGGQTLGSGQSPTRWRPEPSGLTFSVADYSFYLVDKRETPFFIGLDNPRKIDFAIQYLEDAKRALEAESKAERKTALKRTEPLEQPTEQ
jgi:hypothetical protein